GPVHGIGEDGETGSPDRAEVHERSEMIAIRRREVRDVDRPGARGPQGRSIGLRGHRRVNGWRRAATEVGLDLEAVVMPGIVAGGDRDAALEPEPPHVE